MNMSNGPEPEHNNGLCVRESDCSTCVCKSVKPNNFCGKIFYYLFCCCFIDCGCERNSSCETTYTVPKK